MNSRLKQAFKKNQITGQIFAEITIKDLGDVTNLEEIKFGYAGDNRIYFQIIDISEKDAKKIYNFLNAVCDDHSLSKNQTSSEEGTFLGTIQTLGLVQIYDAYTLELQADKALEKLLPLVLTKLETLKQSDPARFQCYQDRMQTAQAGEYSAILNLFKPLLEVYQATSTEKQERKFEEPPAYFRMM